MSELLIKAVSATSAEAAFLIEALSRELAEIYIGLCDGSGDFVPESADHPRSRFLVGSLDDEPVACGAIREMEPEVAEVKRMFVLPEYRGRGLSRAILAALESHARQLNYATIRLETGNLQKEAIALYERSGYHHIEKYGIYIGNTYSVCFEKEL